MQQLAQKDAARFAVPALVVANVALALGPWLVRIARVDGHVGPIGSGFWRLTLALPVLMIAARSERGPRPANMRLLVVAAILSGLFFAADLGAWHAGILHTRLSNATLLGNVTAILFPLYGFLVARTLPSRKQGIALALALVGAVLLLGRSYELSARNLLGDLLCLFAGVCFTGYLVFADRARAVLGPVTTLTWSVAAGIPILLVVALALGDPIWPAIWWPLVLMTLGSQLLGQGLIMYAVSRVSALVVGLMLLLQPIVAATIGWIVYGERLTLFDLAGGLAIALAVLLVRDTKRPLPAEQISLSA
ncbi:DMT family transporter [Sphingomonas crusticola]|uniref:DMT family transporter n=1 Tax=Sphingomonas crusticola TaxID=1697973 RepID=UPI000E25B6B6|nr:DMT family transporter [Sphingomonas crusticola]